MKVNAAIESLKHDRAKGFMRNRFLALFIDFIIVAMICQLIYRIFGTPDWDRYLQMQDMVRGLPASDPLVLERVRLYQECFITTLVIGVIYEACMLVFFGAPIGKLLFSLRVVNAADGRNFYMGKLMVILRSLIKALSIYLLSALPFIFLCLTAFGNPEARSGFDMFAGTKVVDIRSK